MQPVLFGIYFDAFEDLDEEDNEGDLDLDEDDLDDFRERLPDAFFLMIAFAFETDFVKPFGGRLLVDFDLSDVLFSVISPAFSSRSETSERLPDAL